VRPVVSTWSIRGRLTVTLSDADLGELVDKGLREIVAKRGGSRENSAHAREVEEIRVLAVNHRDHDGRDDENLGDALGGDRTKHGNLLVTGKEDDWHGVGERALVDDENTVNVRVGENAKNLVTSADELLAASVEGLELRSHVVVGRHDTLGKASGSRRVAEEDRLVNLVTLELLGNARLAAHELEHRLVRRALGLVGGSAEQHNALGRNLALEQGAGLLKLLEVGVIQEDNAALGVVELVGNLRGLAENRSARVQYSTPTRPSWRES